MNTLTRFVLAALLLVPVVPVAADDAAISAPADFTIANTVIRPAAEVPPLGANDYGGQGAVNYAANNWLSDSGNEPIFWQNLHRITKCGPHWLEIDGPGADWWQLWSSGFLSGATVRVYRLVDKDGQPLPLNAKGDYLDVSRADHVLKVGTTEVIPESKEYPDGGWIADKYATVWPYSNLKLATTSITDSRGIENGRTYYYTVVALSGANTSANSNETSATASANAPNGPRIVFNSDHNPFSGWNANAGIDYAPVIVGGKAPFQWGIYDTQRSPWSIPAGLTLDPTTGHLSGTLKSDVPTQTITFQVTDAAGKFDQQSYTINAPSGNTVNPQPPTNVTAFPGNGCITLRWTPSTSPNVTGYQIMRSYAPADKQQSRVYLTADCPTLRPWDYIVVSRKFGTFNMKYVNPRVRGIAGGLDVAYGPWQTDLTKVHISFVPHPLPIPADMVDPGETCMRLDLDSGPQTLKQTTCIGTGMGGESIWYGQLEPGKNYRFEVWLRQAGLAPISTVNFSFSTGAYPNIHQTFDVSGGWKKYTYDFIAPDRPVQQWHYGPQLTINGPGTLWMDNARLFRYDTPDELNTYYVPNPTMLNELIASQPATGRKGVHRDWVLNHNMPMWSLCSWHASQSVSPDWSTSYGSATEMTLPMAFTFDMATGSSPDTRMRPWITMQHILHSEDEWRGFVEYLAAPYDPKVDTPKTKPWAYLRYQERGTGTPWIDEFSQMTIEFGNETWHNGFFPDWLGFGRYSAIFQGGKEYGLFCQYLINVIKSSPYWASEHLDGKIRFDLGASYFQSVNADGTVSGYGEEAVQACPGANLLGGHANYVGPKWEVGDKAQDSFTDDGVQDTLLGFVQGTQAGQDTMQACHDALEKKGVHYKLAAYEGGPSGYTTDGSISQERKDAIEHYGKSLAMAVAALDAWLGSYKQGWTDQMYLGYGEGKWWSSHTPLGNGFRPHAGWLALTLRNRYASGDLMDVTTNTTPTIALQKATYPLIGVYAMRDGQRWSVFVLSRKLDGNHNGQDFGDGTTPVTLHLPFTSATSVKLYTLAGNPRDTNLDKMNITIQSHDIATSTLANGALQVNENSGGVAGGMPPGCIYLYVFDGAS